MLKGVLTMESRQKILHFIDFTFAENNSVSESFRRIISSNEMSKFEHVIVNPHYLHYLHPPIPFWDSGFKFYNEKISSTRLLLKGKAKLRDKISILYNLFMSHILLPKLKKKFLYKKQLKNAKKLLKKENPDIVLFCVYTPNVDLVTLCKKANYKFISILYDPFTTKPNINKEKAYEIENYVVENSEKYFILSCFYDGYKELFSSEKIAPIHLPLKLEKEEVLHAFSKRKEAIEFAYFGQIPKIREPNLVKDIFKSLNKTIDLYTPSNIEPDQTFNVHKPISGEQFYQKVAESKYLVAIDNNAPFEHYLPAKAYLYLSFTKPIIIFGNNEKSAIKTFFKDYPYFYYHNFNQPLDGLIEFLNKPYPNEFNEKLFDQYDCYSVDNCVSPIVEACKKIMY